METDLGMTFPPVSSNINRRGKPRPCTPIVLVLPSPGKNHRHAHIHSHRGKNKNWKEKRRWEALMTKMIIFKLWWFHFELRS